MLVTYGTASGSGIDPGMVAAFAGGGADRAVLPVFGDWRANWPTGSSARGCCRY